MLVRYNPWQDLNALERQINRLFEDTRVPSTLLQKGRARVPAVELQESEDTIYLKLELPGIEEKDLDIQVTEKAVSISGERKSETKTEDKSVTKTELSYGRFQRIIPLSARIRNTDVTAEYKNGILNLTLPKAETEKNKVVKVNLTKSSV
ncbi:Hsp20/alpha crystallin family protein [Nostoc sp. UHCC 0302]|uniref:Hsp20/alpha crystallin family protein n=1 Tax=Nostoc sp. UHCC 0302 TaxID=3134896 RepID=UPI00311CCEEB